jgi:hypothetical protein
MNNRTALFPSRPGKIQKTAGNVLPVLTPAFPDDGNGRQAIIFIDVCKTSVRISLIQAVLKNALYQGTTSVCRKSREGQGLY